MLKKMIKPPGWFELLLKISFLPVDDSDERLDVRRRYREAVLSGRKFKARRIVIRETRRVIREVWVPRLWSVFLLWSKFRGG